MKYKTIFILIFVTSILLLFGYTNSNQISKGVEYNTINNSQSINNKNVISSFEFSQSIPDFPEKMMVYKTLNPEFTEDDIISFMELFSINGEIIEDSDEYVVDDGQNVLEVFKKPGTSLLYYSVDVDQWLDKKPMALTSEDDAIEKAEEFLKTNNLLPENTFFSGIGYFEFSNWDHNGKMTSKWKSAIKVGFGFIVDGIKVFGPGAKIGMTFGENGRILETYKFWREIEPDKEIEILSFEEAYNNFKQRWPHEENPNNIIDADLKTEIIIDELILSYYAEPGSKPQYQLEPVYIFNGSYKTIEIKNNQDIDECTECSDNFQIIIPAIS